MPAFLDITRESSRLMKEPRKKNPTFGVAVFIVIAVLLVIATLLYNAITEKREFDRENVVTPSVASAAAATAGASSSAH
jgi:signal transduction histidine kinase